MPRQYWSELKLKLTSDLRDSQSNGDREKKRTPVKTRASSI